MPETETSQFSDLLKPEGPVAIIIKQSLAPVNDDEPCHLPPTYPMTTFTGPCVYDARRGLPGFG